MKAVAVTNSLAGFVGIREVIPSIAYTNPKTSSNPLAAAISWEIPRTRCVIIVAILGYGDQNPEL